MPRRLPSARSAAYPPGHQPGAPQRLRSSQPLSATGGAKLRLGRAPGRRRRSLTVAAPCPSGSSGPTPRGAQAGTTETSSYEPSSTSFRADPTGHRPRRERSYPTMAHLPPMLDHVVRLDGTLAPRSRHRHHADAHPVAVDDLGEVRQPVVDADDVARLDASQPHHHAPHVSGYKTGTPGRHSRALATLQSAAHPVSACR